jgi:hypothetical protein
MNEIFRDLLDVCVIVYLDDILVYSKDPKDHEQHLRQVLDCLKEYQLLIKKSKCTFFTDTIEYLRHVIAIDRIRLNSKLVQSIQSFLQPTTLKEMQSFLSLANYYRKFIKEFSGITVPLTNALQKASQTRPIIWDSAILEAFQRLKDALTTASCLKLLDPDGEFEVTIDASEDAKAVGAVLTQDGHSVAFESKKLNPYQLNYVVHDKEMCAIMHALDR